MHIMIDRFGRKISYLRLSVTDRCDFRCVYCMAESMQFLPRDEVLSLEELDKLCRAFVRKGVRKIRLTGGEPLVRRNIVNLMDSLGGMVRSGELDELTLTTNGAHLARHATAIAVAGIRRVNVSLDTLNPARFAALTRRGHLQTVIDGIMAAKAAGLAVKINAVALGDTPAEDIDNLILWCGREGMDLCFIEMMPLGDGTATRSGLYQPITALRTLLARRWCLQDTDHRTSGPASYVTVEETGRRIGFITPMSHGFCEACNRLRLTCSGKLYLCLGQDDAADLRAPLRADPSGALVDAAIDDAIRRKPQGHDFDVSRQTAHPLPRHMNVTGG